MGGFSAFGAFDESMSDPATRNRLLRAMMGSDPSAALDPAKSDRIHDDPVSRNQTPATLQPAAELGSSEDLENKATAGRLSLSQQMQAGQQPTPPSHLDRMQQQYDQMKAPQPKPMSLLRKIALGLITAAGGGAGVAQGLRQRQQNQEFEEGRYDRDRNSLLAQIEAERRMQEQEQLADQRDVSQYGRTLEQQRYQDARQDRLFGQQNQLEDKRETLRQQMEKDAEARRQQSQQALFEQQDKRQNATFAEQEKLANIREQNKRDDAKPTADEQRRADLGNNMKENLDQLEEIVTRRPELFGPMAGRYVEAQQDQSWWNPFSGTKDKDVAALKAIREYLGMASVGAHAMRNAQHVGAAADAVVGGFRNSPAATMAAIEEARKSVDTFMQDVQQPARASKGVPNRQGGQTQGQRQRPALKQQVSDPLGILP